MCHVYCLLKLFFHNNIDLPVKDVTKKLICAYQNRVLMAFVLIVFLTMSAFVILVGAEETVTLILTIVKRIHVQTMALVLI